MISAKTTFPATSFPNATVSFDLLSSNSSDSITSLKGTDSFSLFGISIPTACFPGIGASILILSAAKFKSISSDKLAILLTLTPSAGFNSYLVIAGPTEIFYSRKDWGTNVWSNYRRHSSICYRTVACIIEEKARPLDSYF